MRETGCYKLSARVTQSAYTLRPYCAHGNATGPPRGGAAPVKGGVNFLEGDIHVLDEDDRLPRCMIALPLAAAAGTRDPGVNQRQHNQQQRIQQGVKSGELTRGETHRLAAEQRHIRREEARYKSDGQLTRAERADLNRDQNRASRDIYRQKHDAEARPPAAVRDPGVNARQHNQHDRIAQGVRSGELTRGRGEGPARARALDPAGGAHYKSDGMLTRDERKDLHQDLNAASREHLQREARRGNAQY